MAKLEERRSRSYVMVAEAIWGTMKVERTPKGKEKQELKRDFKKWKGRQRLLR